MKTDYFAHSEGMYDGNEPASSLAAKHSLRQVAADLLQQIELAGKVKDRIAMAQFLGGLEGDLESFLGKAEITGD